MAIQETVEQAKPEFPALFYPPHATEENFRECDSVLARTSDQLDYLKALGWIPSEVILAPVREKEAQALKQAEESRKAAEIEAKRLAKIQAAEQKLEDERRAARIAEDAKRAKYEQAQNDLVRAALDAKYPLEERRRKCRDMISQFEWTLVRGSESEKIGLSEQIIILTKEIKDITGLIALIDKQLEKDRAAVPRE